MPHATFQKLKPEKKTRIREIAYQVFTEYSYQSVSINHLMKQIGIAKGSFYQYFQGKKDLFFYLMEQANQDKQAALAPVLREKHSGFLGLFQRVYTAAIAYDIQHPLESRFLYATSQERLVPELGDLFMRSRKQSVEFFKRLLQQEQKQGKIAPEADLDLLAWVVVQFANGALDWVLYKNKADLQHWPETGSLAQKRLEQSVPELLSQWSQILGQSLLLPPSENK